MEPETIRDEIHNGSYACAIRVAGKAPGQPGYVLIEIYSDNGYASTVLTVLRSQLDEVLKTAERAKAGSDRAVAFFDSLSLSALLAPAPVIGMGMPHQYTPPNERPNERFAASKPVNIKNLGIDVVK